MEWLLLVLRLPVAAGAYPGASADHERARDRQERAVELEAVRRLADEDVTVFGEQLQRLGDDVADRSSTADTRRDYQTALDAYERAKWDAPRLRDIDEISSLVDTLATGRYCDGLRPGPGRGRAGPGAARARASSTPSTARRPAT